MSVQNEALAKILKFRYFPSGSESPVKILKEFTNAKVAKKDLSKMFGAMKKANKNIKNWKSVTSDNGVTVIVDSKDMDKNKIKNLLKSKKAMSYNKWVALEKKKRSSNKKIAKKEKPKKEEEKKGRPEGLTGSLFYMGSQGSFSQKNEAGTINLNINQNSPVSVGLALNFYPPKSKLSYAGSVYYSMLEAPATSSGSQTIEIPAEIGGNLYLQYNMFPQAMSFFGGVDFETFTTFNLLNYEADKSFVQNANNVVYVTAGMGKAWPIFGNQSIFLKLSASFSVMTITILQAGGLEQAADYSGLKLMAYLNYKFSQHWFLHGLFKMHNMSGPDTLSVTRLGGGVGFAF